MIASLLTQFGSSSSGIGALGVNGQAFLIQLLSFAVVFLALRKWAFRPILKILNERRELIDRGVKLGKDMEQEKTELEEKVAAALSQARTEADSIVANAHSQARETVQKAEEKARTEADGIVADAKQRIQQDTAQARKKLEQEIAGLIAETTEAVVGEKIDAKKDSELIDKALKERQTA